MTPWIDRVLFVLRQRSLQSRDRRLSIVASGLEGAFRDYATGSFDQRYRRIKRVLSRTGNQRLDNVGREWWSAYDEAVTADDASFEGKELRMLEMCGELSGEQLGPDDWLELYRICLVSGLFVVGVQLRQRAEAAVFQEASRADASIKTVRRALSVMMEQGHFEEAWQMLKGLRALGEKPDVLEHADWLLRLLSDGQPLSFVREGKSPIESETLRTLQGASVALVGPVPSKAQNGPEIDEYDLVAKFNYRGGAGGRDPVTQGRRVDISYYNIQQAKFIARKADVSFLSDVRYPVFIKKKAQRLLGRHTANGRELMNLQPLLFDSELNAGPNAVFDLLRFAPATIKVFNTDLMLTAGRYKGYSQPGGEEINYSHSFAKTHDPLMQFRWLNLAWSRGLIDGDDRFREVMGYDESTYMKLLQEGHGAIARERLRGRAG